MDMRVLPLQTFSRRTCARHFFRQKNPKSHSIWCQTPLIASIPLGRNVSKQIKTTFRPKHSRAFRVGKWTDLRVFFSFSFEDCWMLYVFFTKIQSFTRASDFCSYETFKDALRGNGDHPTDKANECLPLRRTWTPLH